MKKSRFGEAVVVVVGFLVPLYESPHPPLKLRETMQVKDLQLHRLLVAATEVARGVGFSHIANALLSTQHPLHNANRH